MALGDLYFDVLLNDKTDQGINAIKSKLSKIGADVGASISADIQAHLNRANFSVSNVNVQAKLSIDKSALTTEIQDVLNQKFKLNVSSNIQAKDPQTLAMEAQAKLINAQARLTNAQARQADVANRAALAQARLATEQQRTAREANRAQIEATRLARQKQMLANATNRATQANRSFSNSLSSGNGGLDMLIGKAQRFAQIFAGGTILSSLIKIRGEFELQLVSLRAILQSTERANELYGQLMQLSVISPFQFGDLVKYAKQLAAFQIPANELYDTTKRLADLSAGVGVGMDRLILAYGQVRSAAVLRGTELRQFTEAGIPMVGLLADKFSELEGRVVSAGEVFDKISGKEVPFEMVKDVIEDLTSEGGMFFEMQEKQADTLKGKISNLADAYAIMMNNIGQSADGILKGGVDAIRWSLQNYQELLNILVSIGTAYGVYRLQLAYKTRVMGEDTMATMQNALAEKQRQASMLMQESYTRQLTAQEQYLIATRTRLTMTDYKHLIATGQLNAAQVRNLFLTGKISKAQFQQLAAMAGMTKAMRMQTINLTTMGRAWERLKLSLVGVGNTFKMLGRTMMASWPMLLMGIITELIMKFSQLGEEQKRVIQEVKENAESSITDLQNFMNSHKVTIKALNVGEISSDEAKKFVEKAIEKIDAIAPTEASAIALKAEILKEDDFVKQAQAAKKALEGIEMGLNRVKNVNFKWEFPDYVIEDDLIQDLNNFAQSIENAKIQNYDTSGLRYNFDKIAKTMETKATSAYEVYTEASRVFWKNLPKIQEASLDEQKQLIAEFYSALTKMASEQNVPESVMGYTISMFDSWFNKHIQGLNDYSATWNFILSNLENEDLKFLRSIEGNWDETNTRKAQDIINKTADALNMVYYDAQLTASKISDLEAYINVKLNFTGTEQLTGLQTTIGAYIPSVLDANTINKIKALLAPIGNDYSKITSTLQKALADAQETSKNIIVRDEASRKQKNETDALIAGITATLNNLNQPLTPQKPTTKSKSPISSKSNCSSESTAKPKDEFTLALKKEYEQYKEIIETYQKLFDELGEDEAYSILVEMPGFEAIFNDATKKAYIDPLLEASGVLDLATDYLDKIKDKATDEAKDFRKTLERTSRDVEFGLIVDNLKRAEEEMSMILDKISEDFEEGVKSIEWFYEVASKSGSKELAGFFAFGNSELESYTPFERANAALNDMLREAMNITYEGLLQDEDFFNSLPRDVREIVDLTTKEIDKGKKDIKQALKGSDQEGIALEDLLGDEELLSQMPEEVQNIVSKIVSIIGEADNELAEAFANGAFGDDVISHFADFVDNEELLDQFPEQVREMYEKIKEIVATEERDWQEKVLDARVNTMNIDEQIKLIEKERDELIGKIYESQGDKHFWEFDQSAIDSINYVTKDAANKIGELKAKLQDLLPVWDKIFNAEDGSYKGVKDAMRTINDMLDDLTYSRSTPEGQNIFTATFTDENGVVHTIELTSDQIKKLRGQYEELQDVLVDKNPFQAIHDLFTELKDQDGEIDWEKIGKGVALIADLGAQAAGQLKDMFDALGMEGAAESMEWTQQALEGVSNIAKGFAEGNLIGGISATFGVVTGFLTSIFNKHDEKLQKQIEESQRVVKKLQQEREAIERAIDRGLGGAYGGEDKGGAYIEMLQKLRAERAELEEQYEAEQDKKNTDKDVLIDLEGEMATLDDQIRYLAEDTLAELMEIDLKGWASQIGDALVDAFANGEDAVAAFDQSVGDMIKSVVKNMASLYIIEPMMEDLRRYLFGEDGRGGVFGSDYYIDADELAGMKEYLDVIREKGIPAVKELYEGVDAATGGIMSAGTMEGLSAGIKSVTEDTANLLASYLNAVRADVALIASGNPRMTTIAEAQLVQLNAIALNTSRNALAAESINELLRSVTTTTPQGRVLKV